MADVKFTGNVGGSPVLRFTQAGKPVLGFSVADSKSRKDQNGEWETLAEQWFNISVWGDEAEFYAERVQKGDRVIITGEFYSRKYETKEGGQGTSLDVTAHGLRVFPKKGQQRQADPAWGGQQSDPWGAPAGAEPPF